MVQNKEHLLKLIWQPGVQTTADQKEGKMKEEKTDVGAGRENTEPLKNSSLGGGGGVPVMESQEPRPWEESPWHQKGVSICTAEARGLPF